MTRRSILVVLCAALVLSAQMPDSPTGRMAGALIELVGSGEPDALGEFLRTRVAEAADEAVGNELSAVVRECSGGEPAEARKTGSYSAVVELTLPMGRCQLAYTVDSEPPHGLLELEVGVLLGGPGRAPDPIELPTGSEAEILAALETELERRAADDRFAGVVLLARDGEPVWQRAFGLADRGAGRANTVETRFDVGSITKLITKIAIAQLAQAGTLDLESTVQEILPDYPNPAIGRRITIAQILDHSSGLGDIFNQRWAAADKSKLLDPRDFFPLFVDQPLAFEPGTSQRYSNAGYVLLGAIVEAVSGSSYYDYVERNVFAPAGMGASGFPVRDGSDPGLAIGYVGGGEGEPEPNLGRLPIRGCPAGSSSHTAGDLLRLDRALRGGKLLDPRWTAWVFGGEVGDGPSWPIGMAGGGPGVSALLEGDDRTTVVVLSNLAPPGGEQLGMKAFQSLRDVDSAGR